MSRLIAAALLTTGLAVTAVAPASAAQHAGSRSVCVKSAYVDYKPGSTMIGTLFKHEKFQVSRYSPSGRFAYGYAHGHVRKRGWVKSADLCK